MGLFDQFPYTNFHELNLDWILMALKELEHTIEQFVSINALKYADPIQWNIVSQYEKNTIVIDPQTGTAYISVQPVPSGVALTNEDYWTVVFDLGSFVVRAAKNFTTRFESDTTLTATFNSVAGGWLIWGDTLYVANVNITAGDSYVVGGNIRRITIEEITGHISDLDPEINSSSTLVAAINAVLAIVHTIAGNLDDLSTTDKTNLVAAINDVISDINNKIGNLDDLSTTDKNNIVAAINNVISIIDSLQLGIIPYELIMPHLSNTLENDVTIQIIRHKDQFIAVDGCKTAFRNILFNYLSSLLGDTKLDTYIITHYHGDHANCSDIIIDNFCDANTKIILPMNVDLSQFSGYSTDLNVNYTAIMAAINNNGYNYIIPDDRVEFSVFNGEMHMIPYNYDTDNIQAYYDSGDYNNCSASFRLYSDAGSLYISGDTGIVAQSLIGQYMERADVALIPHHNVNFCGDFQYHINIDADIWIASHQTGFSEFPRYMHKLMHEFTGFRPVYDISSDLNVVFDGDITINGTPKDIVTMSNVYKLISVYPLANDNVNVISDYTVFKNWTLDHLALMSVTDKISRTFEIFNSSTYTFYYETIINELSSVLGGTSWIITVGGGILEARLYSNDNGRRILKYCSGAGIITRYCSLEEFSSIEWSTINDTVGGSPHSVHPWGYPALLGCDVEVSSGNYVEVLLYNTKRTATYHGYATYGGGDTIYVNVTISNNVLTINACKRTARDGTTTNLNLIDIGPVW